MILEVPYPCQEALRDALGVAGSTTLLVLSGAQPHLEVSARNLPGVAVVRAEGLNVYDVLRHEKLVIDQGALDAIGQRLGAAAAEGSA